MNDVATTALKKLEENGIKARAVSVKHLVELQNDLKKRYDTLDKQVVKLIEETLKFNYDIAATQPEIHTIFITATAQPVTRARFAYRGKKYNGDIPPTYISKTDDARAEKILNEVLQPSGYKISPIRLPSKTLADRSGLTQYGRNNITYVAGLGSYYRLRAFAADCPCEQDSWQELAMMKACEKCFKCGENCPTGAITRERFLIHAEKCLTWHNEREEPFEGWIKAGWHNALIGCMRCQTACPVNSKQLDRIVKGPEFSEAETELILQKTPFDKLPKAMFQKLADIAMDDSPNVLARNLKALIER